MSLGRCPGKVRGMPLCVSQDVRGCPGVFESCTSGMDRADISGDSGDHETHGNQKAAPMMSERLRGCQQGQQTLHDAVIISNKYNME